MQIITNNKPRLILYAWELTNHDLNSLGMNAQDVIESQENGDSFFRYKGECYNLSDFMRSTCDQLKDWDGCHCDTFFSGILVKFVDDNEQVIVGSYYN